MNKYGQNLVDSMPQVLSFEELGEARKEIAAVDLDPELAGYINLLVRDFQACIRDKERSEVKPPALCEGCHFIRNICGEIKEPLSERATVALMGLAKANIWLHGECDLEEVLRIALWVLPHRVTLVRN